MIVTEVATMTEAAPAIERVYQALCFYNSTGPPRRQAGFMIFNVLFHFHVD